ncbi:MAG: exo-alpha-sialidase [Acidobacteria bacterium]|nr:exo-alpha-sialidase [Acidobacteriota bacterium]MBI3658050.1 exo-alpha-sialidase [Acidobacteriota bacterium]
MSISRNKVWYGAFCALALLWITGGTVSAENEYVCAPEKTVGAHDPSVIGVSRPAKAPVYFVEPLDVAVGPNVLVNDRQLCPNGRGLQQNETSIAVAGDVVVVAFNDARGGQSGCPTLHAAIGWGYSLDGGATFTDGGTLPQSTHFNNGDPWLGVSPDGQTFYLSGLWDSYRGFGFYRGTATADDFVWQEPVVISFGSGLHDKEAFVVDPNSGTIYMSYTLLGSGGGIKLTRSYDGGDTWASPVTIGTGGQGSFPAVDNSGTLYVAYNAGSSVRVARSWDGGDTFQNVGNFSIRVQSVTYMDRSPSFPQVAVDMSGGPRDGAVYVVWQSLSAQNVLRPYLTASTDNGDTWSAPVPVNDDTTSAFHWWPSVSVDSNGNVNVIWLDRRLNPGTGLTDVYFGQSTDGGGAFLNVRVTDVSGNWQGVARDPGFCYVCDYIRAVSYGTDVYATWSDPRNGDPDIYFSRIDAAAMAARPRN